MRVPSAPPSLPPPSGPGRGEVLHFAQLAPFAPEQLLEFTGGPPESASTSKYGELAVSEYARSYRAGDKSARVRIVDTNANEGQRAPPPPTPFEDAQRLARPIRTGGSVGYVEFDKRARIAKVDLVVADRVLVSIVCEGAAGPEDVERLAAAMDLGKLALTVRRGGN